MSVLSHPFIYDDVESILDNINLHQLSHLKIVLFSGLRQIRIYQNVSFALEWAISGPSPWAFRVVNILYHLMNTFLLYKILDAFSEKKKLNLFMICLFFISPIQIQSVHYIMGRTSLVQGFAFISAIYFKLIKKNNGVTACIIFLSLLVKESCLLITPCLFLLDLKFNHKTLKALLVDYWCFSLTIPLYIVLYWVLKDPISMYDGKVGFAIYPYGRYLLTQAFYLFFQPFLIFNPTYQSIIHPLPRLDYWVSILGTFGGIVFLGLIYLFYKTKDKVLSFCLALYFAAILPTGTFIQMINPFAEYRLYLSNILFFYLIACVFFYLASIIKSEILSMAPAFFFLFFQLLFLKLNLEQFRSLKLAYLNTAELYPENQEINYFIGGYLVKEFPYESLRYYQKAVEAQTQDEYHASNKYSFALALNYFIIKNYEKCLEILNKQYIQDPNNLFSTYRYFELLANAYRALGNEDEFKKNIDLFEKAKRDYCKEFEKKDFKPKECSVY